MLEDIFGNRALVKEWGFGFRFQGVRFRVHGALGLKTKLPAQCASVVPDMVLFFAES